MSSNIDFRTLPANVPVLCIPRVYPNITESRIRRIFDDLNMGVLERIDIVSKNSVKPGAQNSSGFRSWNSSEKGEVFNRVFIHFRSWNDTKNANIARERLLNGKEIKIIYDDPWFWKISAYREVERKPMSQKHSGGRKAIMAFDSDEEKLSRPSVNVSHREDHRDEDRLYKHDDKLTATECKFFEPRTPSISPPRMRQVDNDTKEPVEQLNHDDVIEVPLTINYGNILPPPPKNRFRGANKSQSTNTKPLKI